MAKKYDTISQKKVFSNPYWEYLLESYMFPDGSIGDYHYVRTNGSVMIIPQTSDNKFVLTKQFRYLNKKFSWEFPGGGIKKDTDSLKNARQELQEETGYFSDNLIKIGIFNPFNGVTDEICNVYLAKNLILSEAMPDNSEEFEIAVFSKQEIELMIRTNEIWDGMTLAVWSIFQFSEFNLEK